MIIFSAPRLDLTSTTSAAYYRTIRTSDEDENQRHVRHANHFSSHNHHKKNRHSSPDLEFLSNKVKNLRSDHLHRENSNEEET